MREVKVFKWEQQQIDGKWTNLKVYDSAALFHQFGQDDNGEGQSVPVAIIETPDGHVRSVYCEMVQFTDTPDISAKAEPTPMSAVLTRLDGYMENCHYGKDHPWRVEIADALRAAGAA